MCVRCCNCAKRSPAVFDGKMSSPKGSSYLRLTPVDDSASHNGLTTSNRDAARPQNKPRKDTSVLSGAGAWTTPDADADFNKPTTRPRLSISLSPTQARPQLYCDTQQKPPSISFSGSLSSNEIQLLVAKEYRHDSFASSTELSSDNSPCDVSSPSEYNTGSLGDEEDAFFSAQSSHVFNNSRIGSPLCSSLDEPTLADAQLHSDPKSKETGKEHFTSSQEEPQRDVVRRYLGIQETSSLSVPESGRPREPSVISDAGEQQQLRRQQKRRRNRTTTPISPLIVDSLSRPIRFEREALQKNLYNAMRSTASALNPSESLFLPRGQLDHVINSNSVRKELRINLPNNFTDSKIQRHVDAICIPQEVDQGSTKKLRSFRKIFAILVLVEMAPSIKHFIREDVSDIDLPLVPIFEEQTIVGFRRRDVAAHSPSPALNSFGGKWSPSKCRNFEKNQWVMLAPFFSQGEDSEVKHYILQDNHILPFIDSDQAAEYRGGFAKVTMVHIHSDHHGFKDTVQCERGFAIKQLYNDNREAFARERRILKMFSGPQSHEHVVSLLATYEQHKKFNLLFYRAEGDLSRLWRDIECHPALNYHNILWMAKQCAGIADGLMQLHRHLTFLCRDEVSTAAKNAVSDKQLNFEQQEYYTYVRSETMQSSGARVPLDSPTWVSRHDASDFMDNTDAEIIVERFGRHGDLDPSNILLYNRGITDKHTLQGTLKIADFGQAKINSPHSKTTQSAVANKETYRPPECDVKPRKIRQSYDIWCLGCVYLEFVAWVLGGTALLQEFALARLAKDGFREDYITDQFFELVKLKDSAEVEAKIKPAVTKYIDIFHRHDNCTDFIHDLLNLILQGMLEVDSEKRKPCHKVKQALDDMYSKCLKSTNYASRKCPWLNGNTQTTRGFPYSVRISQIQPVDEHLRLPLPGPDSEPVTTTQRTLILEKSTAKISISTQLEPSQKIPTYPMLNTSHTVNALLKSPVVQSTPDAATQNHSHISYPEGAVISPPSDRKHRDRRSARARRHPIRKTLADQILPLFVKSTFDEQPRDYLPEHSLEELLTEGKIEDELKSGNTDQEIDEEEIQELTSWISNHALKVFAITLQCDGSPVFLLQAMLQFKDCNFNDKCLPIKDPRSFPALPRPEAFEDDELWSDFKHNKFFKEQWICLVPVFGPQTYDYNLSAQCILPFTKRDVGAKGGAFSSVYRVHVHECHLKHRWSQDIAIKQITVGNSADLSDTDKAWDIEARALASINQLHHDSILKCVAAIRRGNSRYFMFPWADGDSLRDFWNKTPKLVPNASMILQVIQQLRSLADALDRLHNFDGRQHDRASERSETSPSQPMDIPVVRLQDEEDNEVNEYQDAVKRESIRHGDLKPENILRFMDQHQHAGLGNLKIADMGLAKRHVLATQDRNQPTSMTYGTRRYEAPETVTAVQGRSRLYDIWSIGCIAFEFIIWVLHGNERLTQFYSQAAEETQGEWKYYETTGDGELNLAVVNKTVMRWVNHLRLHHPECQTATDSALKDLLKVVCEKLLVVSLPPNRASSLGSGGGGRILQPPALGESKTYYRATAAEFRSALDGILRKADQPNYLFTGNNSHKQSLPMPQVGLLYATTPQRAEGSKVPAVAVPSSVSLVSGILGKPIGADYTLPPLEDWTFHVDNVFAGKVLAVVGARPFSEELSTTTKLCARCLSLDFWKGGFYIEDSVLELQERAKVCDLCRMLQNVHHEAAGVKGTMVRFERKQSVIMMTGHQFPVLSIFRSPHLDPPFAIQLGFPVLPEPASDAFFATIRLWLQDCDHNHPGCSNPGHGRLPTRLIEVGTVDKPLLRLVETCGETVSSMKYIALSHPWGNTAVYQPFSTLRHNLEKFKTTIPYEELPGTFKDAVNCTRNLGIHYLWIDSICIIQGADGDFAEEAKRMSIVFSGAHFVIAASRATDQRTGFLGPRPQGDYITLKSEDKNPFYICKIRDNFSKDVIEGTLNQRGWVLQERALARRTIYFTGNQTYFECGNGVRCETLTRMQNNMADFLGDPQFPAKAMRTESRALKIAYFQGLYKQFSRLSFTRSYDRPFAISGLEKRLQKAFDSKGTFGIFDDNDRENPGLFHRSLLWQRDLDNDSNALLHIIDFPPDRDVHVPSWSWMAYEGAIDYCDPPFRTADWETERIRSPWNEHHEAKSAPDASKLALTVTAHDFTVSGRLPNEVKLTYDTDKTTGSSGQRAKCVIVARSKEGASASEKIHYVLIVASTGSHTVRGGKIYRRIGAGFMLGKYISLDTPDVGVKVQ
ncbi:hypothetical protein BKA66DRAFT_483928 [Pyrenochaeta sp. MPI-SDFR-AT-0127]|nr:hypothetical protein BKA66DRAFT_483928 [Pyrenochaeta sp. MPI-SDFR-AT-0127]